MISLNNVSLLLPYRHDDETRLHNLLSVLEGYSQYFSDLEVIIVEDKKPESKDQLFDLSTISSHYVSFDGEELFNKSKCYNDAALLSTRPYILCADTDIFVEPEAIMDALEGIDESKVAMPYNGVALYCKYRVRSTWVKHEHSLQVLRHIIPSRLEVGYTDDNCMVGHLQSPGGAVIFEKETFIKLGGYNPEFRGWGYEDDEILKRFVKQGCNPTRATNPRHMLWHFHHANATKETHSHYKKNLELAHKTANPEPGYFEKICPPLT